MWWRIILFIGMSLIIWFSFTTVAPQEQIGEASRIFYYHIPQAWICVVAFAMSGVYSALYLRKRQMFYDDCASDSARLGFLFCLLATITGSIFAKVTWGSFWNWDPRETSIFILLLIYGAYFALRSAIEDEERKATLSAVYSIFAFVTVPFLVFVLPRMVPSLHPTDSVISKNLKFTMSPLVRTIFFSSLAAFSILYLWLFSLMKKLNVIRRKRQVGTI